jgi:hypothetical protein
MKTGPKLERNPGLRLAKLSRAKTDYQTSSPTSVKRPEHSHAGGSPCMAVCALQATSALLCGPTAQIIRRNKFGTRSE